MAPGPARSPAPAAQACLQSEEEGTAGPLTSAGLVDHHQDVCRTSGAGLGPRHRHADHSSLPPSRKHNLSRVTALDRARHRPRQRTRHYGEVAWTLEHGQDVRAQEPALGDLEFEPAPSHDRRRAQAGVGHRQPAPLRLLQEHDAVEGHRGPVLAQGGGSRDGAIDRCLVAESDVRPPGPTLLAPQGPGPDSKVEPPQVGEPGPGYVQENHRVQRQKRGRRSEVEL